MRTKLLLPAGLLVLAWPVVVLAQQQPGSWDWPGPWHMWGGWGMWWVFPLLIIASCIAMILLAHRSGGAGRHQPEPSGDDPTRSALQILNERFARGDIQRDEYEERKRAILTVSGPTGNL